MNGFVKFFKHFRARFLVHFADDVDGDEGENESRYDFVQSQPAELLPNEDGQAADDDAGQSAVFRHAPPVQGQENRRAEGCAEACPGISDHGKDIAVWIQGQDDGQGRDDENGDAADEDQFLVAGVLTDKGMVEVFGNGRRRDEKLRRRRTHDSRQYGR